MHARPGHWEGGQEKGRAERGLCWLYPKAKSRGEVEEQVRIALVVVPGPYFIPSFVLQMPQLNMPFSASSQLCYPLG